MLKRIVLVPAILIFILGACTPSPVATFDAQPTATILPTLTASPGSTLTLAASLTSSLTAAELPADTPTSTVQLQPSETRPPVATRTSSVPQATAVPTWSATRTRTPTDTSTATADLQPSETPSPTLTPTLTCERETASVLLSVSADSFHVGDTVKVTVTVQNEGCLALGLPQYRLYIQLAGPQSIFMPENPEPVVHSLGVSPGQMDSAEFDLLAVADGQATLTATVSYEVHIGYPGPAYWGMTSTREPLILVVTP